MHGCRPERFLFSVLLSAHLIHNIKPHLVFIVNKYDFSMIVQIAFFIDILVFWFAAFRYYRKNKYKVITSEKGDPGTQSKTMKHRGNMEEQYLRKH